jgi:hypothetical protein
VSARPGLPLNTGFNRPLDVLAQEGSRVGRGEKLAIDSTGVVSRTPGILFAVPRLPWRFGIAFAVAASVACGAPATLAMAGVEFSRVALVAEATIESLAADNPAGQRQITSFAVFDPGRTTWTKTGVNTWVERHADGGTNVFHVVERITVDACPGVRLASDRPEGHVEAFIPDWGCANMSLRLLAYLPGSTFWLPHGAMEKPMQDIVFDAGLVDPFLHRLSHKEPADQPLNGAAFAEAGYSEVALQIVPGQEHAIEDWGRIRRAFA